MSPLKVTCPPEARRFPLVSTGLSTCTVLDTADQFVHLLEHHAFLCHLSTNLLARVHDGGVITSPEFFRDLRIAVVGELAEHIHPDLAGRDERSPPALAAQVVDGPAEHLGGLFQDDLGRDDART